MTYAMFLIAACTRQAGLSAILIPKILILEPSEQLLKLVGAFAPAALVKGPKRGRYLTQGFFTLKIIQIFNMKGPEPGKAVYFINDPLVKLLTEAEAPQA
ncbi:hypothetical protein [Polaromonas sp. YR568]|uniref:hypothetical protein n=1 Tax=Polaromonas sp. YR568 TaxID=1855301 RepID=UPI00398BF204